MNKYEQLVEFIINDETDKARELFHNIVVEKSRDIYESLIDEADLDEVGGNQVQGLVDEISLDEEGISEEEAEDEFGAEEESDMDFDDSGDLDSHEEEHASDEERIDDLEAALDELKAEFDALMADEAGEEEHADMGGMDDMGAEEAPEQFYEAEECDTEEDEDEEELDETIVREYVEKVAAPSNTEGADNKTSTVAGKNDFGGSSKNIATGKAEQSPDGRTPNASVKPQAKLKGAGSYENVPGAKAGNAFAKKETGKTGEGQTTGKSVGGVNTKSPLAK